MSAKDGPYATLHLLSSGSVGDRKNHRQLTLTDDEIKRESGQEDPLSGIRNLFDC